MITKGEILVVLFLCLVSINEEYGVTIPTELNSELLGPNSEIDSILLVNFIVAVEESIEKIVGEYVPIADERAFSLEESPFRSVESLCDHIYSIIKE